MDLIERITTAQTVEKTVKFKDGKDVYSIRLRPPSHADAVKWGNECLKMDKEAEDGKINDAYRKMQEALLSLRYTLVVDEPLPDGATPPPNYQPELDDEQLATLLRISGGIIKMEGEDGGELARASRDLMWESNAIDPDKYTRLLQEAAEKEAVPLESRDGTA